MMQPGEYCYVISMEMGLKNFPSGKVTGTYRGTFPVPEGYTRLKVTNQVIEWTKGAIREDLAKTGRGEPSDIEPVIYFLSIDPN